VTSQPPDLSAASERTRQRLLTRYLQDLVTEVAGLAEPPPRDVGLFDLGVESLHAVEIKGTLELAFGIELDDTLLIEEPTIAAIVRVLDERTRPDAGLPGPVGTFSEP
jgi:acyl carrier protein